MQDLLEMKANLSISLISLLLSLGSLVVFSQGSGDAGLQSSGEMDSRSDASDTPTRIYFLERAGIGNENTVCLTSEVQFDWNIWGGINIWFALPYQYNMGGLATVHGVGDLRVSLSHTLAEAGEFVVKISFGGVIPSGDAGKEVEGKPLPMVYQPSQGSASFLVSSIFYYRLWSLSAGYQRPVSGNGSNFTHLAWDNSEDIKKYPESPGLLSGDDLVFRVRKDIKRPKARYSISLLPSFRLNEDRILQGGRLVPVENTSGFSMNVNAGIELMLGNNGYFHFLAGVPVFERDHYPDGLDRAVVVVAGFGLRLPE